MELFSQRKNIKPVKSIIQSDSMDDDLRNRLWNVLFFLLWKRVTIGEYGRHVPDDIKGLVFILWNNYFKRPLDTIPTGWSDTYDELSDYFFQVQME